MHSGPGNRASRSHQEKADWQVSDRILRICDSGRSIIMWLFFYIMGCSALYFILLLIFFCPSLPHYSSTRQRQKDARRITWTNKTPGRQHQDNSKPDKQPKNGRTTTPNGRAERRRLDDGLDDDHTGLMNRMTTPKERTAGMTTTRD